MASKLQYMDIVWTTCYVPKYIHIYVHICLNFINIFMDWLGTNQRGEIWVQPFNNPLDGPGVSGGGRVVSSSLVSQNKFSSFPQLVYPSWLKMGPFKN